MIEKRLQIGVFNRLATADRHLAYAYLRGGSLELTASSFDRSTIDAPGDLRLDRVHHLKPALIAYVIDLLVAVKGQEAECVKVDTYVDSLVGGGKDSCWAALSSLRADPSYCANQGRSCPTRH